MNWQQTLFEAIDMRSFSNLWFWIALAVVWSSASHWVLGLPYDMVTRARRHGGTYMSDLEEMTRINVNRLLYIEQVSGMWLLGLTSFLLTGTAILGFAYVIEFAQAAFLLGFPMSLVALLSILTARRIRREEAAGEALCRLLSRHRLVIQMIGTVSIFVTALWGMFVNLSGGLAI